MFTLADPEMIGSNLKRQILAKYPSVRAFGQTCLQEKGEPTTKEAVQRMANRLSQITQGNKDIQLADIPLFAELLKVSPEYILSGGKEEGPVGQHLTNAAVAKSEEVSVWEEFLSAETPRAVDEYGKTLVEYALEYKNQPLIHYLVEKGEIRFWGEMKAGRQCPYFGAEIACMDTTESGNNRRITRGCVPFSLSQDLELREKMIFLAIEHQDIWMLQKMQARETPEQYRACTGWRLEKREETDPELVAAISASGEEILSYFTQEYTIGDAFGYNERWLSPVFPALLEQLLPKGHPMAEKLLQTAVAHNQYACDRLQMLFDGDQKNFLKELFASESGREMIRKEILETISFDDTEEWILYIDVRNRARLATNLIHTDGMTARKELQALEEKMNALYRKIHDMQPNVREKGES